MTLSGEHSVKRSTPANHAGSGGAIPACSLYFRIGEVDALNAMVRKYHYSHRPAANIQFVGTFHTSGGLFGTCGDAVAGLCFSIPPTRWSEPVLELSRLVRTDDRVPLSKLISLSCSQLKRRGHDLLVSFADMTHNHMGYVYRASGWTYGGIRTSRMDGLLIDGEFYPGRTCNSLFGTQSPTKLQQLKPTSTIEPHFDCGKHLYWKALGSRGLNKAVRLGLENIK